MFRFAATHRTSAASAVVLFSFLLLLCLPTVAPAQEEADALALYRQGRYNEAVAVTLQEIEAMPRNMDSYTVLGWSLLALGRYQDALEYGLRALEISRFDVRVIGIVGEAHYNLGNYLQALDYFEEYVAIAPTGTLIDAVYFFMGEIFLRFEEYNHADIAFSAAVFHDGNNPRWWARLGFAREQALRLESALEAYNRALQLNPNLADAVRGVQRLNEALSG